MKKNILTIITTCVLFGTLCAKDILDINNFEKHYNNDFIEGVKDLEIVLKNNKGKNVLEPFKCKEKQMVITCESDFLRFELNEQTLFSTEKIKNSTNMQYLGKQQGEITMNEYFKGIPSTSYNNFNLQSIKFGEFIFGLAALATIKNKDMLFLTRLANDTYNANINFNIINNDTQRMSLTIKLINSDKSNTISILADFKFDSEFINILDLNSVKYNVEEQYINDQFLTISDSQTQELYNSLVLKNFNIYIRFKDEQQLISMLNNYKYINNIDEIIESIKQTKTLDINIKPKEFYFEIKNKNLGLDILSITINGINSNMLIADILQNFK
ncbi:hypothetical protein AVANS_0443 [Campylobacter sp. RM5004]|uniref:hypothetical protein n=1 Tax=Campylobacter sp. RM5004 TaxID=1660078 RepID=UPI001EFB080D|nr:hypothetical protein [Campylobacter sp. RM5004]ULO01080.1 hypothetical protein AVANS_0443 [Campylobacter sp. RM5004]